MLANVLVNPSISIQDHTSIFEEQRHLKSSIFDI